MYPMSKPGKPSHLAQQIKTKRLAFGWTQAYLAERADVNRQQLAKLETGRQQDLYGDSIARIAKALGSTSDELLGLNRGPVSPVVDAYLSSPLAEYDKPTKDEVAWLRGINPVVWHGDESPDEHSVHELLVWHRRKGRKSHR
jgi:transcriptional regulator with XRE-family HTH domain